MKRFELHFLLFEGVFEFFFDFVGELTHFWAIFFGKGFYAAQDLSEFAFAAETFGFEFLELVEVGDLIESGEGFFFELEKLSFHGKGVDYGRCRMVVASELPEDSRLLI